MLSGEIVRERYVVEGLADSGGMGTVYRASDRKTGGRVALKVLHGAERRTVERFAIEVHALSALAHPAIVKHVDHGVLDDGRPFLVMEWIEGESLGARLVDRGVSLREALALASRLVSALAYVHARGIVHRDLKPTNVMLPRSRVLDATLVDFGIARISTSRGVTATGARLGTVHYMAPEQIRSPRSVDGRADVFALGCILFECLTGRRAFDGFDDIAVLARVVLDDAPLVRALRPEVPVEVCDLVAALLARDHEKRPRADEALSERLSALALRLGAMNLAPVPAVGEPPIDSTVMSAPPERLAPAPSESSSGIVARALRASPLPTSATPIVGRDEDVRHAREALRACGGPFVLWGPAGIGKTRLALEIARSLVDAAVAAARETEPEASQTLHGAAFCDLRDVRDSDGVLREVSLALHIAPCGSTDDIATAIGRILEARGSYLLVLDNVDAVADPTTALVAAWAFAAPAARLLVTAREKLRIPGVAIEVGPLPTEGRESAAARLFAERAAAHDAGAPKLLASADATKRVESIVRALDGNPLAIELAAARLRLLGLDELVLRLEQPLDVLAAPGPASQPRTMRDTLAWSWDLLRDEERTALARLSVFRGGFDVIAAEAVLPGGRALDLVQSLREKSFLTSAFADDGRGARLGMSGAIREFAGAKLEERKADKDGALARHGEHCAAVATRLARDFARTGSATSLRLLAAEVENVLAAVDHALATREARRALALLLALDPVLSTRGPFGRYLELLDAAIAGAPPGEPEDATLIAQARQARGRFLATKGRFDAARADLDAALADARHRGDRVMEALVLLDTGVVHHLMHELGLARAAYEASVALDVDDVRTLGRALGNLGALHHDERRFDDAYGCYVEAIALFESLGDDRLLGIFLMNLALLDQERGDFVAARQRFERAIRCIEAVQDRRFVGIAVSNLGMLELERGEVGAALTSQERAHAVLSDVGDARSEALCLGRLGAALACLGRLEQATMALAKGERLAARRDEAARNTVRLQRAFLVIGGARRAIAAGDFAVARASLDAAVAQVREAERELAQKSDDVRAALRVLRPILASVEGEIEVPAADSRSRR